MSRFSRVAADEQMLLELGHTSNLQDFSPRGLAGAGLRGGLQAASTREFSQQAGDDKQGANGATRHRCEDKNQPPDARRAAGAPLEKNHAGGKQKARCDQG